MKIAIYANEIAASGKSGVKTYSLELVKGLLGTDDTNEYSLYAKRDISPLSGDVRARMVTRGPNMPYWAFSVFPRLVRKDRPDVVFIPIQIFPFFMWRKHKPKVVVTIHDVAFLLFPDQFTPLKRSLLAFHTRRAAHLSDAIIVPSEATKRDVIRFYGVNADKVTVIAHGVASGAVSGVAGFNLRAVNAANVIPAKAGIYDSGKQNWIPAFARITNKRGQISHLVPNCARNESRYSECDARRLKPATPNTRENDSDNPKCAQAEACYSECRYILFVGTIQPRKNIVRLAQAFAMIKADKRFAGVKLVICGGKGWMYEEIYAQLDKNPYKGDIMLTGMVDDGVLAGLYAQAELFILPSLYEGFGLPVLEAMSHGLPVIASDNSSLAEIVGDAGLLVDAESAEDMADKLKRLLLSPTLKAELSQRSLERVKEFSWEKAARETNRVILNAVKDPFIAFADRDSSLRSE